MYTEEQVTVKEVYGSEDARIVSYLKKDHVSSPEVKEGDKQFKNGMGAFRGEVKEIMIKIMSDLVE